MSDPRFVTAPAQADRRDAPSTTGRLHSGLRHLVIEDRERSTSFPAIVQYPTATAATGTHIGPYRFDATLDAPLAAGSFPICVISHGGGGSHLLYRTIATHLASNGYIVVVPEHPGDNRNDRSLSNTDAAALQRPRHASLALDAILSSAAFRSSADGTRVCAIGHSMGGYTVLALVGGHPWSRSGQAIEASADARVGAAVLLAPSTDWFLVPGALADVSVPLLVVTGELDEVTPTRRVSSALSGLPPSTPLRSHEVEGAGHYSFLSPFPHAMRRTDFPPSVDPPGFDRERFQVELGSMILAHLATAMPVR